MTSRIFNLQSDGRLIEMRQEPFANEDVFQALLEEYPNLLAGDQINSHAPRRWLLVRREMGVADQEGGSNRWALDHLFLVVYGQTAEADVRKGTGAPTSKRPLTESELQQVADERGIGELYSSLVQKLRPLFEGTETTQSNLTFVRRLGTVKRAAIISLTPVISKDSRGVRYGVYADRVAALTGQEKDKVVALLPNCDLKPPNWGGGYMAGFVDSANGLDLLIDLLRHIEKVND